MCIPTSSAGLLSCVDGSTSLSRYLSRPCMCSCSSSLLKLESLPVSRMFQESATMLAAYRGRVFAGPGAGVITLVVG